MGQVLVRLKQAEQGRAQQAPRRFPGRPQLIDRGDPKPAMSNGAGDPVGAQEGQPRPGVPAAIEGST